MKTKLDSARRELGKADAAPKSRFSRRIWSEAAFAIYCSEREPKDWDITTNAKPDEIQKLFPETFYENNYGTVGVVTETENPRLKVVEVTPYRIEGKYSNARHPDEVRFSEKLEDDLERRDFTINAIAYDPASES